MSILNRRQLFGSLISLGGLMAILRGDELDDLLAPAPAGQAQAMTYRQGVVLTFDPVTLSNRVSVGGSIFTDLPMLGVAEAASLAPGSVVGLMCVGSTWAIIGRIVTPGTADATDAITRIGQAVETGFIVTSESTTSVPYTDLTTPGPAVTVHVRASGKVLIFLSANISVGPAPGALWGGFMNVELTGANTVAPSSIEGSLGLLIGAGASPDNLEPGMGRLLPMSGLTPGETTFTCKYAVYLGAPGETATFRNRSIAVFTL